MLAGVGQYGPHQPTDSAGSENAMSHSIYGQSGQHCVQGGVHMNACRIDFRQAGIYRSA